MAFKDTFSYHEAVKALKALDEARQHLETAQTAFEEAARHEEATGPAESVVGGIEDLLSDLEAESESLRDRVGRFDEHDGATWYADQD